MAITARRLRRLEAWSNWRAAGGARQAVVDDAISVHASVNLENESLLVTVPLDSPAAQYLGARKVLRVDQDDATYDEYRIIDRATDDAGGALAITAAPFRVTDLQGAAMISRKDSDGVVVFDFEVLGLTPLEVITNWVLPALAASGFGWISAGTITPTARLDMTFAWDSPLAVLLRLASATQCELDVRRNGDVGYFIDLVTKVNNGALQADIRVDKNLVNVTTSETSIDQATRVAPRGADMGDGMRATMARATWQVTNVVGAVVTLADPAGGKGPIQFDMQLCTGSLTAYLRTVGGVLRQVTACSVANQTVTLASATGVAIGDMVQFRANAAGDDLVYLDSPAATAAYGIKGAVRDAADVPATNNFVKNAAMRAWPGGAGSAPTNWTAVGAPTLAKQVAAPFTAIGGQSIKVTSTSDGDGVISDAVLIFPTVLSPYLSGFAKLWVASGNARVELVITTPSGTKVFPVLPNVATPTQLAQWADVGVSGYDANGVAATAVQIRIVQNGINASVLYVDAAQVSQSATQQPWFEGSGGTRLWQEANEALRTGSNPVVSYSVRLADLETTDPVTWSDSALILGSNAHIVDARMGVDVITRIAAIERDYINPEATSVTLSTRFDDLTDLLAAVPRPDRIIGDADTPATTPQQPKLTASFDINGQLIINSAGDYDVTSHRIAWATGSAPTAATVRAATPIAQQNVSGLATGSTYAPGTTVFIAAFVYNAKGYESAPLTVASVSREGFIQDYTSFAANLTPIKIVTVLPGAGAYLGETVFLTTDKKLYRWDGAAWTSAVATVDLTGTISTAQIAAGAVTATQLGAAAVIAGKIAANAVDSAALAALSVVAGKIGAAAVTATEIASHTVTAAQIAALTITATELAAGAVAAGKIAAGAVGTTELAALAVTAAKVANATITTTQIAAAAAITGAQIASVTIGAANIVANTITAAQIAANTITAGQIAALTITAAQIAAGAITTAKILAGNVTTTELAALAVTAAKIAANTITATQIAAGTITANEIAAATITGAKIAAGTLTASLLAVGYGGGAALNSDPAPSDIAAWSLYAGTISTLVTITDGNVGNVVMRSPLGAFESVMKDNRAVPIDPNKVYRLHGWVRRTTAAAGTFYFGVREIDNTNTEFNITWLVAGVTPAANTWTEYNVSILGSGLHAGTKAVKLVVDLNANTPVGGYYEVQDVRLEEVLPGTLIMDGVITTAKIFAGAVTTNELGALAVTAAKIAANTITASQIAADTLTAAQIAAGAITSSELAAGAVIAGKIAALTIVAGDIAAATITGAKIAAATIAASNIVANAITAGQIQAGAIGTTELAALAVTAAKIAAGTITASQIAAGTITSTELAAGSVIAGKIAAGAITATEISVGTITADRIIANSIGPSQTVGRGSIKGYKTNAQTLTTGTLTQMTLDAAEFTLGSGITRSANQLVVNDSIAAFGSWMVIAQVGFAANVNGDRHIELRKNGTVIGLTKVRACSNAAAPTYIPVVACVSGLAISDAFDAYISQDSGGNLAVRIGSSAETFISMTHLW